MFDLIDECSSQVTNYFLKRNASGEGTKTVDMKDLFSRFTNDVVATVSVHHTKRNAHESTLINKQIFNSVPSVLKWTHWKTRTTSFSKWERK